MNKFEKLVYHEIKKHDVPIKYSTLVRDIIKMMYRELPKTLLSLEKMGVISQFKDRTNRGKPAIAIRTNEEKRENNET